MNKVNYEERAQVYTDALETFGPTKQLVKALEELTEVQLEICRALDGRASMAHLAEEVADATIMLEQVRQIFGINAEVCQFMDAKVLRLRGRVEQERGRVALRRSFLEKDLQIPRTYADDDKTKSGLLEED